MMKNLVLTQKFEEALLWAIHIHSGQYRKGTSIPYISHLLGVASIVMENSTDEDVVIAALLHDAVEDHGGLPRLTEIEARYGRNVANIVLACSDSWESPKPPYKDRKRDYIKKLPNLSEDAQLVSLADKLHNARSIFIDYQKQGEDVWDRFTGEKSGTLWYYQSLVDAFKLINNQKLKHLVDEFARVVTFISDASK